MSELFISNRVDSDRNAIQGLPNTNAVASAMAALAVSSIYNGAP